MVGLGGVGVQLEKVLVCGACKYFLTRPLFIVARSATLISLHLGTDCNSDVGLDRQDGSV